jgi:hypothetical protein
MGKVVAEPGRRSTQSSSLSFFEIKPWMLFAEFMAFRKPHSMEVRRSVEQTV